jgi:hypothetical protein
MEAKLKERRERRTAEQQNRGTREQRTAELCKVD